MNTEESRTPAATGVGGDNHKARPILPLNAPYRQYRLDDDRYLYRWLPECWPARDRRRWQRATLADLYNLRSELEGYIVDLWAAIGEVKRG